MADPVIVVPLRPVYVEGPDGAEVEIGWDEVVVEVNGQGAMRPFEWRKGRYTVRNKGTDNAPAWTLEEPW